VGIEAGLADSVRLIADEVRGSVREAMKSLRADLAAASREERAEATSSGAPSPLQDDPRAFSREQLHRADAAINEFRAGVRTDLRSHVARGGSLEASLVDSLASALESAAAALRGSLRN
jgi:hypothetical protein